MKVKIKKLHPNAVIPTYAHSSDAGLDLTAVSVQYDKEGHNLVCGTGLAFEIPEGCVGLIFSRSSIANKDLILSNSLGVLDSGYRGEVMMKFKLTRPNVSECKQYATSDRIGQLIILPYPQIEFEEVDRLSESERGAGGYGSTGN